MIDSHARHRLPGESFEDYKARRLASDRALATAERYPPAGSSDRNKRAKPPKLPRDLGQHPKLRAERKRKPKKPHGPTWPRTKDQRRQSRPLIVVHPVRAALLAIEKPSHKAPPGAWNEYRARLSATRVLAQHLPKHALDRL